jgi:ESCRT-I complex subunit TSG101
MRTKSCCARKEAEADAARVDMPLCAEALYMMMWYQRGGQWAWHCGTNGTRIDDDWVRNSVCLFVGGKCQWHRTVVATANNVDRHLRVIHSWMIRHHKNCSRYSEMQDSKSQTTTATFNLLPHCGTVTIMVSDPRVSQQLTRLGGIYRDPARIQRDASTLLKSSVGSHLQPISAVYADETNGDTHTVLVLQGTVAIHYRGQTYQLLMDMYLVPAYPMRPPVCYVRLAPNMYLKENHKHVAQDGKVHLSYLQEWNPATHNLVEMTVAISSVFSNDPPVFSRPPTAQDVFIPSPHTVVARTAHPIAASDRRSVQQREASLAREAEAANTALMAARQAEQNEAVARYEQAQTAQMRQAVNAKLQTFCREQRAVVQRLVQEDAQDQRRLPLTSTVRQQKEQYQARRESLQKCLLIVEQRTEQIQTWLMNVPDAASPPLLAIDDLCVPEAPRDAVRMQLAAENATLSDAMYFLDQALYDSKLSIDLHLKHIRSLAKQQFLVRAHLLKLSSST